MAFNQAFQIYSPNGDQENTPYSITVNPKRIDSQVLQVVLKPGEKIDAEPGALCYKSENVEENTSSGGLLQGISRIFAGETIFMNTFTAVGEYDGYAGFTPPIPGKIIPLDLAQLGNNVLCQSGSYFVSKNDVRISLSQTNLRAGLFGNEGFFLQKLEGTGIAFIAAYGTIIRKELNEGETIMVDAGCLVCLTHTVNFDVKYVGSVKRALFGGEGLFYAHLTGPGVVYIQSLPWSRVVEQVRSPSHTGSSNGAVTILFIFILIVFAVILLSVLVNESAHNEL